MKWKSILKKWDLESLSINLKVLDAEFKPNKKDKEAAWKMYIELITRITTQDLLPETGDEKTALESIYNLFEITRTILKEQGRECEEFTKLAVIVLNQVIRPFTAKWHKLSLEGAFERQEECDKFREELSALQGQLRNYTKFLASIADVEDLTSIDNERGG